MFSGLINITIYMLLNKLKTHYKIIILVLVLTLGFLVRLYRFDNPIADWHSWRQADTSAVSRNFISNGFDLLHPRFDDLSNVPSGLDNPNGYRFVEFPIFNLFQAGAFKLIGLITLEEWGRLINIVGSLFSGLFLFGLIRKRFGYLAGFLTLSFFLFIPFNIYYSRTILPDPLMVTATLGAIYFFEKWLREDKRFKIYDLRFLVSLVFMICALLLKPYALFFTLPLIYLAFEKFGIKFLKKWQLWLFLTISLLPLAGWRFWMTQFPQGIPASAWLFNGNHIRFRPSFFYWIIYERLTKLILGYFGVLFLLGVFLRKYTQKEILFLSAFVLSSLLYVVVIATGNVQHDYYQILIIPSIAVVLGVSGASLVARLEKIRKFLGVILFSILILTSFYFSWGQVKDYFNINNRSIVEAGMFVDKLTPKNAKVIANYNGDTSFLYQTKRKGWASFEHSLPQMITMGADYLILVNPTPVDLNLGNTYKILKQNKDFVIFDLNKKP